MSAYSSTHPGGYAADNININGNDNGDDTLKQFTIDDNRRPEAVSRRHPNQGSGTSMEGLGSLLQPSARLRHLFPTSW